MASTIAAGTTSGTAIAIAGDTSGVLQLQTNGTTAAVTIDTSQNVGIGTASPSNKLSVLTASGSDGFISVSSPTTETAGVSVNGGTSSNKGAIVRFQKNASTKWTMGTDSAIIGGTSDNFHLYGGGADAILFSTNATERMRIASTGLVSTTGSISSGGYVAGAGYYRSSGMVNETVTVTTEATVYSMNKDSGGGGSSSLSTYNITGLSNTDGSSAIIYVRNSNTAPGINTVTIVQIHGTKVWEGNVQNTTKTASFGVFRQNGAWQTTAWSVGGVLNNVW
jgi:hypothetical protein